MAQVAHAGRKGRGLRLSEDEKLQQVRRLVDGQRSQRLRRMLAASPLKEGDVRAIWTWLDEYVGRHEQELLALIPPQYVERIRRIDADGNRRKMLLMAVSRHQTRQRKVPAAQ